MLHEELTERIIECAMEVHKRLGPGLLESNYQAAFALELTHNHIPFIREPQYAVEYRGIVIGHHRPDYVVDSRVVVEIKSVARYDPVFATQVLTYMRLTSSRVGLLLNFKPADAEGWDQSPCLRGPSVDKQRQSRGRAVRRMFEGYRRPRVARRRRGC